MLMHGKKTGFTMVELLVALLVASVILSAVATLAGATTAAKNRTDEMGRKQSHIRHMTRRLNQLIQSANAVLSTSESEFLLWHDLNQDGWNSSDELTRVRRGADLSGIEIVNYETYDDCDNVQFAYDAAADATRLITIWFDMEENGVTQTYTITGRLRASDAQKKF